MTGLVRPGQLPGLVLRPHLDTERSDNDAFTVNGVMENPSATEAANDNAADSDMPFANANANQAERRANRTNGFASSITSASTPSSTRRST